MPPAFSSVREAAAFAGLLLILLLLPAFFSSSALPPRKEIYSSVPWRLGPYPYLEHEIFEEKGDIDIAFMGSSTIYWAINTPYVEAALTKDLGRKATVRTAAWNFGGFDALYFIARDLIENRKVHTIVFADVATDANAPNEAAPYWFRFGDNAGALAAMPGESIPRFALARTLPSYYFAAILGMPRNLLSLIRPNSPEYLYSPERLGFSARMHAQVDNPATRLGSIHAEMGYEGSPFVDYTPATHASAADACVYSQAAAGKFRISNDRIPPFQLHFAREFAALARSHGVRLILLSLPTSEDTEAFVPLREFWPGIVDTDVTMVGIPPATLFAGMSQADIDRLYFNSGHMNKNGQEYFTKLITPSLLKIHENPAAN